jgi:hypothetical protein
MILILSIVDSSGEQYKLKKYVFGSSATSSASPNYKFYNTAGQAAIGKTLNSQNSLYAGFWKYFKLPVHTIELISGWNLISTYINPSKPAMEDIWADIINEVIIVKDNNGNVFIPSFEINTIGNWDPLQAYQVYVINDVSLNIKGNIIKYQSTPIHLLTGWNMAAYIKNTPMIVETALASITENNSLVIAKNNDGNVYIPQYEVNTIGSMIPGQGYQMYLNNNSDLLYPADPIGRGATQNLFPTPKFLKPQFTRTGNNQQILVKIPGVNSDYELGVYNGNNILIGSGAFRNGISIATIWGDNEKTNLIDGAENNEKLKIKLYNTKNGTTTEFTNFRINSLINNSDQKELFYQPDKFNYIESLNEFNEFTDEISIKPNPISNLGIINLNLKNTKDIEINLFTVDGKLVRQIANGSYTNGEYNFEFSRKNLASGEYNLFYKSGDIILTKKLIISE